MLLQLGAVQAVGAADGGGLTLLAERFDSWPQWSLPAPLPRPRRRQDPLLETTVIGRRESNPGNPADFYSDELVLQILHGPGAPRLSRIETLTHYKRCGDSICADQRQVSHAGPGLETDQTLAGRSSSFRLTLTPLQQDPDSAIETRADRAS